MRINVSDWKSAALAGVLLAALSGSAPAAVTLQAAHDQPETGSLHILFTKLKELVEERTKGEVEIRVTCCAKLGDNEQATESLRLGTLDIAAPAVGNLGGHLPKVTLLGAPYIIESEEHLAKIVDPAGAAFAAVAKAVAESGEFRLIGIFTTGSRSVYNSQRPITTPEDLEGMKLRVMSSEVQVKSWSALGASPTSLPFAEVYTGLLTGVIDGAENSPMFFYNMKHFENAKYFSLTNHQYSTGTVLLSEQAYQKIPEQWRDTVIEAAHEATRVANEYDRTANEEFMAKLVESGVQVNEVDPAPFVERARALHDELAKELQAEDLLQEIRAAAK